MYNKCTKNIDLSKLTDAEIIDRFGPAASSIIQLKNNLEQSNTRLAESNDKLKETQSELSRFDNKLKQAESKLARFDNQLKETEAKLTKTDNRLKESEAKLAESDNRLKKAESKLAKSDNKLKKTEIKLTKSDNKLKKTEAKLTITTDKLKKAQAKLAEANFFVQQLYNAIDEKNHKLFKQLKERFAPGTKIKYTDSVDEPYSEETQRTVKAKQKAGRKEGTKNGDRFDFSNVELQHKVIGHPEKNETPKQFYKIDIIPAKAIVTEYSIYDDGERPDQFGESFLTPSLAGYISSRKFQYCLPLYRLETILRETGVPISRAQLADYCRTIGLELEPIAKEITNALTHPQFGAVHADETTLKVIKTKEGKKKDCRRFVYTSNRWEPHQAAVYQFEVDRCADRIIRFFSDYRGTVLCDDYAGYDRLKKESLDQIKLARCWFHWRKRFEDIVLFVEKSAKENGRYRQDDKEKSKAVGEAKKKESYSRKVLNRMDELFAIEKRCIGKTADEVLKTRQRESKPIVEALFSMLRQDLPSRTGALLDATKYGLKIEEDLKSFLDNPYLERSNNRCERAVKDFVRSRKNFLFSYSLDGAKAAGIIRTVVRTARINGLDPEKYISYVLKQFSTKESSINARNNIQSLLPWSIKLPKELKGDLKKLPADLQKQLETKD